MKVKILKYLVRISYIILIITTIYNHYNKSTLFIKSYDERLQSDLDKHVEIIKQKYNLNLWNVPIKLVEFNIPDAIVGLCRYGHFRLFPVIFIDKKNWEEYSKDGQFGKHNKLLLLAHEVYHCIEQKSSEKEHIDEEFEHNKCPKSLMHTYTIPDRCSQKMGVNYYLNSIKFK